MLITLLVKCIHTKMVVDKENMRTYAHTVAVKESYLRVRIVSELQYYLSVVIPTGLLTLSNVAFNDCYVTVLDSARKFSAFVG